MPTAGTGAAPLPKDSTSSPPAPSDVPIGQPLSRAANKVCPLLAEHVDFVLCATVVMTWAPCNLEHSNGMLINSGCCCANTAFPTSLDPLGAANVQLSRGQRP